MVTYAERYLGTVLHNDFFLELKDRLKAGKSDAANSGKKGYQIEQKIPKEKKLLQLIEPLTMEDAPPERFVELIRMANEKIGKKKSKGEVRVTKRRREPEQEEEKGRKKPRGEKETKKKFNLEQPLLDVLVTVLDFDEEDLDCIRAMKLKQKDLFCIESDDLNELAAGPKRRLLKWIRVEREKMEEDE